MRALRHAGQEEEEEQQGLPPHQALLLHPQLEELVQQLQEKHASSHLFTEIDSSRPAHHLMETSLGAQQQTVGDTAVQAVQDVSELTVIYDRHTNIGHTHTNIYTYGQAYLLCSFV